MKKDPHRSFFILFQEDAGGLLPVVDAVIAGYGEVMGGGIEVGFAAEAF